MRVFDAHGHKEIGHDRKARQTRRRIRPHSRKPMPRSRNAAASSWANSSQRQSAGGAPAFGDELGIAKAFYEMTGKLLADPAKFAEMQMKLWQDYMSLWQNSMMQFFGQHAQPVIEPAKGDRRFKHDDWQQNFLYDYIKQSYLIAAKHLHQTVGSVQGLDEQTAKKVDFYTRQYIDALSPSNFVLTNPEVLRETVASGGQNLVKGLNHLLEDLESGDGQQVRVKMTDRVGVPGRRQSRGHTRQGRLPERLDAAHPVRAADHRSLPAPAPDPAAVDQQVLHPRHAREELVRALGDRAGPHRIHRVVGQPRRDIRAKDV